MNYSVRLGEEEMRGPVRPWGGQGRERKGAVAEEQVKRLAEEKWQVGMVALRLQERLWAAAVRF